MLSVQELKQYIEDNLPDNEMIPMFVLRDVLDKMVDNVQPGQSFSKYGYEWIKGKGNSDTVTEEIGDELKGVGDFSPDYWVHLYIKAVPCTGFDDCTVLVSAGI